MFRIKICGITHPDDAVAAVHAGADAIGINFFDGSPRCVSMPAAIEIRQAIANQTKCIGVFVDATTEFVRERVVNVGLDMVQLHGHEPPEQIAELAPTPIIRAFRLDPSGSPGVIRYVTDCSARHSLTAALIDAAVPGEYGGTGVTADWDQVASLATDLDPLPVVLAGGLNASNVEQAIVTTQVTAVDVASGVELQPGQKDRPAMKEFVAACRAGFERVGRS